MPTQTRYILAVLTLFAASSLASTASAETNELLVEMRLGASVAKDKSFDVLDDGNIISTYTLAVGTEVGPALPGLRLYLEYEVNLPDGIPTSRLGGAAEFEWRRHRFLALADWGYHVLDWFRPAARLGAGYSLQSLDATYGSQPPLEDYAHDLVIQGSGAAEAAWNLGMLGDMAVTLSLMTEVGYQMQTDATFDELGYDDEAFDENDPWTRESTELGTINTNGVFWNLGVGVRLDF